MSSVKGRWHGILFVFVLLSIGCLWYSSLWPAFIEHPTREQRAYGSMARIFAIICGLKPIYFSNLAKWWVRWMKIVSWALILFLAISPAWGPTWVSDHIYASLAASLVLIIFWFEGLKEPVPEFFAKMTKSTGMNVRVIESDHQRDA